MRVLFNIQKPGERVHIFASIYGFGFSAIETKQLKGPF